MKPERKSLNLLAQTRSKAKMFEYDVPDDYHIKPSQDPAKLFTLSICLLGDASAEINRKEILSSVDIDQSRKELLFSSHFFDAYLQSKLNEDLDPYLILLGSASYYLCDLPGSAKVLARQINERSLDLGCDGLENLLIWLLKADLSADLSIADKSITQIYLSIRQFFKDGLERDKLIKSADLLRKEAYESGIPRKLLFCDAISAVIKKKIQNSCLESLPLYSGISQNKWKEVLQKKSSIKELWPAQHLIGKFGVLKGESAIVQMPTSAGKTKATEIIIRSAFLSNRTSMAIIVAPFRALCQEIKNSLFEAFHNEPVKVDSLTDALQTDFNTSDFIGHQQILVVTPEKLLYVLRHAPEFASNVGLLIFDEGHQFDNGVRGATYELLITSLLSMLSKGAQKVLISAVIKNAKEVCEWLNGDSNVINGAGLNPLYRSIGFTSWTDTLGRIEYVSDKNTDQNEFFVPRVIESIRLKNNPRERKPRLFPERDNGQDIALYLGLKLAKNGSVAIFCGRKDTVNKIYKRAIEIIEGDLPFSLPKAFSGQDEIKKLYFLHAENFGSEASISKSAYYGIFSHHGSIPNGIRLAIEHALRENLIKFVICTSTLAQGVNLPIRYLIITGVYQGRETIKIRDFQNLIGRAGRAGMHTEGSILFSDNKLYDNKFGKHEKRNWERIKDFLDPVNSEECNSSLLTIFDPIISEKEKNELDVSFVDIYEAKEQNNISNFVDEIEKEYGGYGFTKKDVKAQIDFKISLIDAVENFLLSHWDLDEKAFTEEDAIPLAEKTLAFHLAVEKNKDNIRNLFKLIAKNISINITDSERRKAYGKTLYGIQVAKSIEEWVKDNIDVLIAAVNDEDIIELIWPLFTEHIKNKIFKKLDTDLLKKISKKWIEGSPYHELLSKINMDEAETGKNNLNIEDIVEICERALSYDGNLIINAICEFIYGSNENLIRRLQSFQKRLKYGLPRKAVILIYELGFSDRVISQDMAKSLNINSINIEGIKNELMLKKDEAISFIDQYPSYYAKRMKEFVG